MNYFSESLPPDHTGNSSLTHHAGGKSSFLPNLLNNRNFQISTIMKKQLLVLIALCFVATSTWAAILQVGPSYTYTTVQGALAAAGNGDEIHVMTAGSYSGFTYSLAGTVTVKNMSAGVVSFTSAANNPTIAVSSGKLILRGCSVVESASFNQSGIAITGGELDAGTAGDHGHNSFVVNGAGKAVVNTGGIANAIGNYWGSTDYFPIVNKLTGTIAYDPWCNAAFTTCTYSTSGGPVTTAPQQVLPIGSISVPFTVNSFNNVDAISLTLDYNPAVLQFVSITPNANPALASMMGISGVPGKLVIGWQSSTPGIGVTLAGPAAVLFTVQFNFLGGTSLLTWNDLGGIDCEYQNAAIQGPYNDVPTSAFYNNGWITNLGATVASTNVTCNGANDGTITISGATGGSGTYQYSIDGGFSWQTSGAYTNLVPLTYNVMIRDANFPAVTVTLNPALQITQPPALSANFAVTHVTCFGYANGSIIFSNPNGGYGTYEYTINGINWSSNMSYTGLSGGVYNVQIRDAAHPACLLDLDGPANTILNEPALLAPPISGGNITQCQQIPTQTLTATATPVAPGNAIVWYDAPTGGNVVTSPTLSAPGTVTYYAANFDGVCYSQVRTAVTLKMDPVNVASIAYYNGNNQPYFCTDGGLVNVTLVGTTGGIFSVLPATGLALNTSTGAVNIPTSTAGTYTVAYTMAGIGICPPTTVTAPFILTQLPTITTYQYDDNPFCFDAPNAIPNLVASSTSGIFTIPNPPFGLIFNNATGVLTLGGQSPANTYTMLYTIPASLGCPDVTKTTPVTVRPAFTLATSSTMESCNGALDGTATVTPTGGMQPLSYVWNTVPVQTTATATGLAHGTYSVTVTDSNSPLACVQTATVSVGLVPLPTPVVAPIGNISTVNNSPVIIHAQVTYPTFTIAPAYKADALITTTNAFPVGAKVTSIQYQDGINNVTIPLNFALGNLTSVYLSDVLGTAATPLAGHSGLTINWTITVEGINTAATYPITFQTVAYVDRNICVAPIGNPVNFSVTYAYMDVFAIAPASAQIMCYQASFTFTEDFPAIQNMDPLVKSNGLITSNNPIPAGTTITWSTSFGNGTYLVTAPMTSIYVSDLIGASLPNPVQNENNASRVWTITMSGPNFDDYDYILTIQGITQLNSTDYPYSTASISFTGLPTISTTQIANIATITNTPVVIHQTATYPATISAIPSVMTDALISSNLVFPTGAVIEKITYNQGSGTTTFNVNYALAGKTQVYLSDVLGSASPLAGHAGLTIDWTFTISGFAAPQTYGITITPIAYTDKSVCYSSIGSAQFFELTYANLVSFAVSPNPAQIICNQVEFGFNIQYPAIQNIDNNSGVIKNNAVITSNVPLPASTLNWSYNGNPGTPYTIANGTTQIYLSDITGMAAPLQGHGNLNDTWMFTLSGATLAANDYTFTIQNVAQLGNDYLYNSSTLGLNGLPVVALSPILDISTITKTPVIIPATVTYPAVITAQNSVLTDALFTTTVPFPAGAVIESVTYDQGAGTVTFPVNYNAFNGIQNSFYLSDILGVTASPLNGHAGLTINWTFTVSGFNAPYNGTVTVSPVAYQTKGYCESVIGNVESFDLVFADLISYTVTPASPVTGCNNQATFTITVVNPAIQNVHPSVTTDALLTSNIPLPTGTIIGWSYNGSPVTNYTLPAATSSFYLSTLVGASYPIVGENLVTAAWTFTVTVPNTAVTTYNLEVTSLAKLGTSYYPYHLEFITLTIAPTPVVSVIDLQARLGLAGTWYPVAGSLPNYDLCIDPANVPTSYNLDIASLTSNIALEPNFYNPFYLPATPSAALLSYWAAKGVNNTATGWQGRMWQIINGQEPMVYVYFDGSDYMLVDGLQHFLYGGTPMLTIPGDYPEDVYALTGQVKEDSIGCLSAPFTVNLSLNTVPQLTITGTDVTCNGANDGTIDLTVVGTHAPFNYNWSGPTSIGNIQDPVNLAPGAYFVMVSDTKGCESSIQYTINEPAMLQITSLTAATYQGGYNISCNGLSDGSISMTVTGGIAPYTYAWTGPVVIGNVEDPANIPAGTYYVTVTDFNGCTKSSTITLTQPNPLVASISSYTNVSCFGFNNGTATVQATGGYAATAYQYYWTPSGQTTATAINLAPVTHSVLVTDDNGCTAVAQITLTEPAEVLPPTNPGHITVCGTLPVIQTITATATVPAGHHIVWYNQAVGGIVVVSPTLSTVGSVTYYAEAVNTATGCPSLTRTAVNLQIDQPASAIITYLDNPYCSIDGIVPVYRTGTPGGFPGGTPGGTYFAFSPGIVIDPVTGAVNTGTSVPGTYTIGYVMPANGTCPSTITTTSITIEQLPAATISYNTPFCHNGGNQSVTIVGTPGGLFSYYSYPSLGLNTITGEITLGGTSLPGTYTVFYSFAATAACPQVNTSTTVQVLDQVAVTVASITNETCVGSHDGSISINISGFVAPVTYTWSGPTAIGNIEDPIGLSQGTYSVTVTDFYGCSASATAVVSGPPAVTANVVATDVTCFGANNGTITVTNAAGGWGTYQYTIDGGVNWVTNPVFTGLIPGTYDVQIRDALTLFCIVDLDGVANTVITEPVILSATVTSTNVNCYNASNGTISILNAAGGHGLFEYSIDGGATWQATGLYTNIGPGSYGVKIRDAAVISCVMDLGSVQITQPNMLLALVIKSDVTCFNAADGSISLTSPMGGSGNYEYSIDGGLTWQTLPYFTGLTPATYNVWIRDAASINCTMDLDGTLNTLITQPLQLAASVTSGDVTCNGAADGYISITGALGGHGTYEYSIDGGLTWQSSGSFTGLTPLTYNVQIRDAVYTYCVEIINASVVITQPTILSGTVAKTDVTCDGAGNGTITVNNAAGGHGTFEYSINGGMTWQTGNVFSGLVPNIYNVWIRDAQYYNCVMDLDGSINTTITQPQPIQYNISSPTFNGGWNVSCNGASDGSILVGVYGGTMPYQYNWFGPVVIGNVNNPANLPAGLYIVNVVDANGCSVTTSITLSQPSALIVASGSAVNVSCPGSADGSINITVTGGTSPLNFVWTGPTVIGNVEDPYNLLAGVYNVTIIDANGCSITYNITVGTTPDLTAPTFVCPQNIMKNADAALCGTYIAITTPVATDNCDPNPVVTGVRSDMLALNAQYPVGVTTITWTALDINGQSSSCVQTITVYDNQLPTITCPPTINTIYSAGYCNALVNVGMPQTSDNCGVSTVVGVRSDMLQLSDPYPSGVTTITWTVADIYGNMASCVQTINVTPTELLSLYNFNYATQYAINPDYIAPTLTGYCTSFEPFLLTSTGTTTGNQAFISDINFIGNNGLSMAQSNGNNVRYFEFRVFGDSLYKYRDYQLYLQGRREANAATQIAVYYSFDAITFWPGDSMTLPSAGIWFQDVLNLTGHDTINYTKNLYLRLYVKGANNIAGNTRLDIDNFQLTAVNGPLARPDFVTVQKNGTVTIDVLANDYYGCNGQAAILPIVGVDVASNGTSTMNPNGTFTYAPDFNYLGYDFFTYQICDGIGKCDTAIVRVNVITDDLYLIGRVYLQGAYDATSGLMTDVLRNSNYLPTTEPYSAAPYNTSFTHANLGGGETTTPAVLAVTGPNAIVDWVFIELRDKNNNNNVMATRAALLQRDGDIVDMDGTSAVKFSSLADNQYFVAIRHRNHLGVMSANSVILTPTGTVVDFTNGTVTEFSFGIQNGINYTTLAQKDLNPGVRGLHAGNAANDNKVKYQGVNSDRNRILFELLNFPGNTFFEYNYNFAFGYFSGDVNMDGQIKYQGSGSDSNYLLNLILNYLPGASSSFDFMIEQLP